MCGVASPQGNTSTQPEKRKKKKVSFLLISNLFRLKLQEMMRDHCFPLPVSNWNSIMALSLYNPHLLPQFSAQHRKFSIRTRCSLNQNFNREKPQLQRFAASRRRLRRISTVKSASVNGYPISKDGGGGGKVELSEKLKKWVKFAREIFPGGDWWRLPTEEIVDVFSAKPVTVVRALKKMWDLISEDRWVIFTAFVSLVVTAVCAIQFKLC